MTDLSMILTAIDQLDRRELAEVERAVKSRWHDLEDEPSLNPEEAITATRDFPSPTELLRMSADEREVWIQRSFELAAGEEFEIFEAFGEEHF